MSTGVPSETASAQNESKANAPSMSELGIENTNINTAQGVELDPRQKVLVGSVLDLFAGRPSLKKLQLWADDAEFNDPITHATGRKQYEPQWYGLVAAFSEIERLSHNVTSSGNPITMDMKTRYKVKGIGMEKVIESVIKIKYDEGTGKITEVQDRWNNEVPEGAFAKVSKGEFFDLFWWANYWMSWGWWAWGLVWWTMPWLAVRNLNSVTVPAFVSVPKNEEEDAKKSL